MPRLPALQHETEQDAEWARHEAILSRLDEISLNIGKLPQKLEEVVAGLKSEPGSPRSDLRGKSYWPPSVQASASTSGVRMSQRRMSFRQSHMSFCSGVDLLSEVGSCTGESFPPRLSLISKAMSILEANRADAGSPSSPRERRRSVSTDSLSGRSVASKNSNLDASLRNVAATAFKAGPLLGSPGRSAGTPRQEESASSHGYSRSNSKSSAQGTLGPLGPGPQQQTSMRSVDTSKQEQFVSLLPNVTESTSNVSDSKPTGPSAMPPILVRRGDLSFKQSRTISLKQKSMANLESHGKANLLCRYWSRLCHHHSCGKMLWDVIMTCCVLFLGFLVPLQLAYVEVRFLPLPMAALVLTVDVAVIMDVVFHATMPIRSSGETMAGTLKALTRYAKTWLILDLLTAFPLSLSTANDARFVVFRMLKMLKCSKLFYYLPCLQVHFGNAVIFAYLKVVVPVLLLFHCLTCIWHASLREDKGDVLQPDDSGSWESEYVLDLYWLLMTMSTVGYGDVSPAGVVSRIYAICLMFLSSFYSGFVVSSTSRAIKMIFDDTVEARVRSAASFMTFHKVPFELQMRVERFIRRQVQDANSFSLAENLFQALSPSIEKDLVTVVMKPIITGFPLFKATAESFLSALSQAHRWIRTREGELVVEEGQIEQELVFVMQGSLTLLEPDTTDTGISSKRLSKGCWFGEASLFLQRTRAYTVLAGNDPSELAVLQVSEYKRVLDLFPYIKDQHITFSERFSQGEMSIDDLACPLEEPQEVATIPVMTASILERFRISFTLWERKSH
eukprot:TRINITY_DN29336_c0_g1_i1.p1 TRINITY_DN29336_c0_g1~~TRINITY_DN29336_c0_g1_i1.p1  ORF type:complete len:788 (-),score=119.32 TRINITY_DN29336_c0_g1_i1:104-2467(-)